MYLCSANKSLIHKQLNIPYMFAKLNKIGELTKILSVKSETCDSIMHFMACFCIGRILSKHSLDKMRGRDMVEQILAMMVFRILGESIGFMFHVQNEVLRHS